MLESRTPLKCCLTCRPKRSGFVCLTDIIYSPLVTCWRESQSIGCPLGKPTACLPPGHPPGRMLCLLSTPRAGPGANSVPCSEPFLHCRCIHAGIHSHLSWKRSCYKEEKTSLGITKLWIQTSHLYDGRVNHVLCLRVDSRSMNKQWVNKLQNHLARVFLVL